MGEAFIVRRGGSGGKFRKMEVVFDTEVNTYLTPVSFDVGFKPKYVYIARQDDGTELSSKVMNPETLLRASFGFAPETDGGATTSNHLPVSCCKWQTLSNQWGIADTTSIKRFTQTETGFIINSDIGTTIHLYLKGTYTVWAYG